MNRLYVVGPIVRRLATRPAIVYLFLPFFVYYTSRAPRWFIFIVLALLTAVLVLVTEFIYQTLHMGIPREDQTEQPDPWAGVDDDDSGNSEEEVGKGLAERTASETQIQPRRSPRKKAGQAGDKREASKR